jgi:hypothetical protein
MHGAPLPETGSFHEQVLSEVILRERNAQFAAVALMAKLISRIGGLADNELLHNLDLYKEELFQLRYNSRYRTATERWKQKMRNEAQKEAKLMERIANMTAED